MGGSVDQREIVDCRRFEYESQYISVRELIDAGRDDRSDPDRTRTGRVLDFDDGDFVAVFAERLPDDMDPEEVDLFAPDRFPLIDPHEDYPDTGPIRDRIEAEGLDEIPVVALPTKSSWDQYARHDTNPTAAVVEDAGVPEAGPVAKLDAETKDFEELRDRESDEPETAGGSEPTDETAPENDAEETGGVLSRLAGALGRSSPGAETADEETTDEGTASKETETGYRGRFRVEGAGEVSGGAPRERLSIRYRSGDGKEITVHHVRGLVPEDQIERGQPDVHVFGPARERVLNGDQPESVAEQSEANLNEETTNGRGESHGSTTRL